MDNKLLVITNIFTLIVLLGFLGYIVWIFSLNEETVDKEEECIDVNKVSSLVYDVCYDAYTNNIFVSVDRAIDFYDLRKIKFSFFDFSDQIYEISDVPYNNEDRAYKIPAGKNPQNIDVSLEILKDFSAPICSEPRKLFVKFCPTGISKDGLNVSISPLGSVGLDEFIEVEQNFRKSSSDTLYLNLVEKERIWDSLCDSVWSCSPWEECANGVSKRTCEDRNKCFVSTEVPDTVRYCDGTCVEDWECKWSSCSNGFTTPDCSDLNRCGTKFDEPQELECNSGNSCIPHIVCEAWSECSVDYNFLDLIGEEITEVTGTKRRICKDLSLCSESISETRECSVGVDIYTKKINKCGTEYVGVYNKLNNELIARIEQGTNNNPFLNLYLDYNEERSE